jgi:hypothetical protein
MLQEGKKHMIVFSFKIFMLDTIKSSEKFKFVSYCRYGQHWLSLPK